VSAGPSGGPSHTMYTGLLLLVSALLLLLLLLLSVV
jgi:hypothetical protein